MILPLPDLLKVDRLQKIWQCFSIGVPVWILVNVYLSVFQHLRAYLLKRLLTSNELKTENRFFSKENLQLLGWGHFSTFYPQKISCVSWSLLLSVPEGMTAADSRNDSSWKFPEESIINNKTNMFWYMKMFTFKTKLFQSVPSGCISLILRLESCDWFSMFSY